MTKVAFIGAGLIGGSLAQAMAKREGFEVVAYNRTQSKVEALEGVTPLDSAVGVVRSGARFVHITMSEDSALDQVLSDSALINALVEHKVLLIDHTTASPEGTKARIKGLQEAGVEVIHAPVFMSPAACLSAQGVMVVSGPAALVEEATPHLEAMTGKLVNLGERVDAAASYKLFGNALIITLTAGLADVYTMADEMGFSREQAIGLIDFFNPGGTLNGRGRRMAQEDYSTSFEVTMARKDVRLMMESAGDSVEQLITLPAVAARLDALIEKGFGEEDLGAIARKVK